MVNRSNLALKEAARTRTKEAPKIKKVVKKITTIKTSFIISMLITVSALLGFMVFSIVQLNQVTSDINQTTKQIRVLKSEQVRLNSEAESLMSLSNIENYAKQKLDLSKLTSGQTTYISLSKGNSIVIPTKTNANWFENITAWLNNFFHIS